MNRQLIKRSYYVSKKLHDAFKTFCHGKVSEPIVGAVLLWMCTEADIREEAIYAATELSPEKAVDKLRKVIAERREEKVIENYVKTLSATEKARLLRQTGGPGQTTKAP